MHESITICRPMFNRGCCALASWYLLGAIAHAHPHHSAGSPQGFVEGLLHPWTGWDHWLAALMAGVLAAAAGTRAVYRVPMAFLAAMMAGLLWSALPVATLGGGAVLAVGGLAVAVALVGAGSWPVWLATAVAAAGGALLGVSHGEPVAGSESAALFLSGWFCSTALIYGFSFGLGVLCGRASARGGVPRTIELLTALAGVWLLTILV